MGSFRQHCDYLEHTLRVEMERSVEPPIELLLLATPSARDSFAVFVLTVVACDTQFPTRDRDAP